MLTIKTPERRQWRYQNIQSNRNSSLNYNEICLKWQKIPFIKETTDSQIIFILIFVRQGK